MITNLKNFKNKWYFGKNRYECKVYNKFDVLSSLKPGEVFILEFKYTDGNKTEYALMKRTKCRQWNYAKGEYEYVPGNLNIHTLENFYQNFFGLNSTKTFESIDDPELNLLTNIHFGKDASKLPMI